MRTSLTLEQLLRFVVPLSKWWRELPKGKHRTRRGDRALDWLHTLATEIIKRQESPEPEVLAKEMIDEAFESEEIPPDGFIYNIDSGIDREHPAFGDPNAVRARRTRTGVKKKL